MGSASIDLDAALARIRAARERIAPYLRRTPVVASATFGEVAGAEVHLKLENLQRTGSFKSRGALNKLLALDPAARARGLIAASAGNHAQGVALAARLCGARCTIVMPEATPLVKIQRTEGYGAKVILAGSSWDESQGRASELAREQGLSMVHAFDDPDVIDGQGTVGLEILEDVPRVDTIVVPIGGGGLIAGIALAVKAQRADVRVVGVQASGAAAMTRSFETGRRVSVETTATIADGIRVGTVAERTFELVRALVDECLVVEDEAIEDAVVQAMEKSKVVAEPAGAAALAAVAGGRLRGAKRICAVVSGGNIDLNLLARLIEHGLARAGRYHLLKLRMPDSPGHLHRAIGAVAASKANILDVQHHRAGWKVPVGKVDVEILAETRHARQGAELEAELRRLGYEVRAGEA
jgi:threonine dehydratase